MKKNYVAPQMEAVEIKQSASLLAGSGITGISSNPGINLNLSEVGGDGTGDSTPRSSELDEFFMNFE